MDGKNINSIIKDLELLRHSIEFNEFAKYGGCRIDPKWTFKITQIIKDLETIENEY